MKNLKSSYAMLMFGLAFAATSANASLSNIQYPTEIENLDTQSVTVKIQGKAVKIPRKEAAKLTPEELRPGVKLKVPARLVDRSKPASK